MDKHSSIIIYTTEDGYTNLQVRMENETGWLSEVFCSAMGKQSVARIYIEKE